MKYIVTSATSCIGNSVYQYLLYNGEDVVAVMRQGPAKEQVFMKRFTGYENSLQIAYCDFSEIVKFQDKIKFADVFINFAWVGTTKEQRNDPAVQLNNMECALTAMKTSVALGCKVYVEAGSQAEYGWQNGELITEESKCEPFSEYGKAKLKSCKREKFFQRNLD